MRPIYTCRACGFTTDGEPIHLACAVAEYAQGMANVRANLTGLFAPLAVPDDGRSRDRIALNPQTYGFPESC